MSIITDIIADTKRIDQIEADSNSISSDTTPQLGGNLDLNGFDIPVSASIQAAIDVAESTAITSAKPTQAFLMAYSI